jgi:5-methylcytosine-specific restriction endonuclease McrA
MFEGGDGEKRMVWPFQLNRRLRPAREVNVSEGRAGEYACHYCERTDGSRTRDHKVPRVFGGTDIAENIVRCLPDVQHYQGHTAV